MIKRPSSKMDETMKRKIILGVVVFLAMWTAACPTQQKPGPTLTAKDREIHVNKDKPNGVEEETVVVYTTKKVKWSARHNETWEVDFKVSPFQDGTTKITPATDQSKLALVTVAEDTAYKYSVTVDGVQHDPQIIIMGGN